MFDTLVIYQYYLLILEHCTSIQYIVSKQSLNRQILQQARKEQDSSRPKKQSEP